MKSPNPANEADVYKCIRTYYYEESTSGMISCIRVLPWGGCCVKTEIDC